MKQLNDKDIASISVLTIDSRRPETIGLIKKHGINLPANAPTQLVDKAFISLAKQNSNFRADFSALAHDTSLSFTGSNEGNWFNGDGLTPLQKMIPVLGTKKVKYPINPLGTKPIPYPKSKYNPSQGGSAILPFTGSNEGDFFNLTAGSVAPKAVKTSANSSSTDTTAKTSGWKDYFANLFTPEFSRDILNTGLNVWSNKQIKQNAVTTQNALDEARYDLQDKTDTTKSQGMGVGSIILISVGALALIGGIIYFVRKK